jgi:hypothetical protein
MTPHIVTADKAPKIAEWLRDRGGLLVWPSVNLSNPGASWTTPARNAGGSPVTKPTWESASQPERVITDAQEVLVSRDIEVKRFRVGVRMSGSGLSMKVTDGGSRRVRSAVMKAGDGAYHVFDYSAQEAVIMRPEAPAPLVQFIQETTK